MKRQGLFALIGSILLLAGCQSAPLLGWSHDDSESTVMPLWEAYQVCRSTLDLDAKQSAARYLAVAAQHASATRPSPIPLPWFLRTHVVHRAPRYSVDPHALSASCSLSTGETALHAGRHRVAADMFQFVLANYSRSEYEYYARRARQGLQQIELDQVVSVSPHRRLIPVSSSHPSPGLSAAR